MSTAEHPTDKLLDLAYDELAVADAREVETHMAACASCANSLASMKSVREVMAPLKQDYAPEAGLASLMAYAERAAQRSARGRKWKWLGILLPVTAVATLLLVVVGVQQQSPADMVAQYMPAVDRDLESNHAAKRRFEPALSVVPPPEPAAAAPAADVASASPSDRNDSKFNTGAPELKERAQAIQILHKDEDVLVMRERDLDSAGLRGRNRGFDSAQPQRSGSAQPERSRGPTINATEPRYKLEGTPPMPRTVGAAASAPGPERFAMAPPPIAAPAGRPEPAQANEEGFEKADQDVDRAVAAAPSSPPVVLAQAPRAAPAKPAKAAKRAANLEDNGGGSNPADVSEAQVQALVRATETSQGRAKEQALSRLCQFTRAPALHPASVDACRTLLREFPESELADAARAQLRSVGLGEEPTP
jgi:hypothetical protein